MLFGIFVFLLVIGIVFFGVFSYTCFEDARKYVAEAKNHAEKGDKQAEAEATKKAGEALIYFVIGLSIVLSGVLCLLLFFGMLVELLLATAILFLFFSLVAFSKADEKLAYDKLAYSFGAVATVVATVMFLVAIYIMTHDDSSPPPPPVKAKVSPSPAPSAKACGTPLPHDNWSELRTSLCNYQQDYNNRQASFKQVQQRISGLEKAISTAEQLAKDYQAKKDNALAKLQEAFKQVIDHPDISIDTERTAYRQAKLEFEPKQQALTQLQTQLRQATEEQKRVEATMQTTQNQINALEKQLKSAYFASFKAKVEQERVIEVEGESGCNQLTVQQCREAAEQEALQVASKQAAVNFLNAETLASLDPHGNLQLTKDEIRSQTRAAVMGHQILECKFVTPAGSAYSCKIRATVKGLVPPELEQQLGTTNK